MTIREMIDEARAFNEKTSVWEWIDPKYRKKVSLSFFTEKYFKDRDFLDRNIGKIIVVGPAILTAA